MLHAWKNLDVSQCHGCGLCALVCPVYQQDGSVMKTPHGMAKARQAGGVLNYEDIMSCVLCGACAPMCPQSIPMMQMLAELRCEVAEAKQVTPLEKQPERLKTRVVLIADSVLLEHDAYLENILGLIGNKASLAPDQASDISHALHNGNPVSHGRLHQFLTSLQPARQIIVSDGLLMQLIKEKLPQINTQSLGQVLSSLEQVQQRLNPDDLYVMDSSSYHADYKTAVQHYDRLHRHSGCQLNRDLHCLAIPVGDTSNLGFDQAQQIEWLLQGKNVKRIVAESVRDVNSLSQHCSQPVIHVVELTHEGATHAHG